MMERNFTLDEAADLLRIPEGTIRKHKKEIGYSKLGKRLIFNEKDLKNWTESRRVKPARELEEV